MRQSLEVLVHRSPPRSIGTILIQSTNRDKKGEVSAPQWSSAVVFKPGGSFGAASRSSPVRPTNDFRAQRLLLPHGAPWIEEQTAYQGSVAEGALAHIVGDKVEAAYRRDDLLEKRRQLMNAWPRAPPSAIGAGFISNQESDAGQMSPSITIGEPILLVQPGHIDAKKKSRASPIGTKKTLCRGLARFDKNQQFRLHIATIIQQRSPAIARIHGSVTLNKAKAAQGSGLRIRCHGSQCPVANLARRRHRPALQLRALPTSWPTEDACLHPS